MVINYKIRKSRVGLLNQTQKEISKKTGININRYRDIENNKRYATRKEMKIIAKAFNLKVSDLI